MTLPALNLNFLQRLNPRERKLLIIVVATAVLILNLMVISLLLRSSRELRSQYAEKTQLLQIESLYAQEQPMWAKRAEWLKAKQPTLVNRDRAGTELLDFVQAAARASNVLLPTFNIRQQAANSPDRPAAGKADYQPVVVEIDTQSDWNGLVRFLASLQKPESFLVFESASVRSEPNDATKLKGNFRVAKWYAPATK